MTFKLLISLHSRTDAEGNELILREMCERIPEGPELQLLPLTTASGWALDRVRREVEKKNDETDVTVCLQIGQLQENRVSKLIF